MGQILAVKEAEWIKGMKEGHVVEIQLLKLHV